MAKALHQLSECRQCVTAIDRLRILFAQLCSSVSNDPTILSPRFALLPVAGTARGNRQLS